MTQFLTENVQSRKYGLGKTFSALGVIKYYETRNKTVLVLCPKRLSDNWNTFKYNYKNNPLADDRLRYVA